MSSDSRLPLDTLFMGIAQLMAQRSTCLRAKVGAIITVERRIVSTGYVGAPPGKPHCLLVGCDVAEGGGCQRTIHAEANAVGFAARNGARVAGGALYTTLAPCYSCAQIIVAAGITRLVFGSAYRLAEPLDMLKSAGVQVTALETPTHNHPFLGYQNEDCLLCHQAYHLHS